MKYFKLDLLTLLISLFIFSSCEKDGTIGLDIDPQDSIKSVFVDTATVTTVTVAEDTIITSGIAQNPFGRIIDPVLGTTKADLALGLSLPSSNFSFGSNPTLDSAVLVLKYGDEFFGDSLNSKYVINVYQLDTVFNTSRTYYSNENFKRKTTAIGGLNNVRSFKWTDSTAITAIVKGGPEKPAVVAPQIRIPLTKDFVNTWFLGANSSALKNSFTFSNYIKGLYVSVESSESTGTGGIVFVDLQSAISALEVYYKTSSGAVVDTNVAMFKVSGASAITHNRAGTPVEAQLNSPQSQSYSTVYVQPLAGLRTKIRFPYIKKLAAEGNISVNKAELVIPVVNGANDPLKPAPRLTLYRSDIAGQRQSVPDNAIGLDQRFLDERIFGGFYNPTDNTYTFNITSYIQDLISKPIEQYDTFIAPIDLPLTGRSNIFPSATTAARSILGGGTHSSSPIKLRITYTKPN